MAGPDARRHLKRTTRSAWLGPRCPSTCDATRVETARWIPKGWARWIGKDLPSTASRRGPTLIGLAAFEQVVADGPSVDRHVLTRAHKFVTALLAFLDEYEVAADKIPAFTADRVENHGRFKIMWLVRGS